MFVKSFLGSGAVTAFNALRAFAINKLLAVFLPPAAFACVGQFMNLLTIGQATSSLALQNGWTSLTAQNFKNEATSWSVTRGSSSDDFCEPVHFCGCSSVLFHGSIGNSVSWDEYSTGAGCNPVCFARCIRYQYYCHLCCRHERYG